MSRIGKQPVKVPAGVKVELTKQQLKISGSKETLDLSIHPEVTLEYDEGAKEIRVGRSGNERLQRAMHGTTRALIANMIQGVTSGFSRALAIYGTGYGVKVQGNDLLLTVGMAQPVTMAIPQGIAVEIKTPNARGNDNPALFSVGGASKQVVGQFAAEIRRQRPPEPYKGKGIRYADEHIKRKVGKAFGAGA